MGVDFMEKNRETVIEVNDISKSCGTTQILDGLSVQVQRGEVICVIGPSGSGKSTFLRCVNRLEDVDKGNIYIEGVNITREDVDLPHLRSQIGMVFQGYNLFRHMTVLENLVFAPVQNRMLTRKEAREKAFELLDSVGLMKKANSYPFRLSGGEKQRVAITRSLMLDPKIMLYDEPTSALDPVMTKEVQNVIKRSIDRGMTSIIVTHEISFAKEVADRIVFIQSGRLVEEGTVKQVFESPRKEETKWFLSML